ncbi:uncharacterized protein LY89DRAFT_724883 [Mollisia scopiformis]|uniref:Uncharacterized protein n=1 Tax=Mollisia scopiformis TaxID=149040 RepID=A0A132BA87_MOLSC|nr:uncharacterized protein LY89DRAFT_724883 [Mollisia scopiformis]KUJ08909.1 hypothetical protein LY89DRAFT_724883 [Mollisia scopiformis]
MAYYLKNGGTPRRKAVPLDNHFQPVAPQKLSKTHQVPGSIPGLASSSSPAGTSQLPLPPPPHQRLAPTSVFGPVLSPGDPMNLTPDYEGFGHLGSPHAAWVYQQINYPAICSAFGPPPLSEIPAYAFWPAPFVVPAAYRFGVVPPTFAAAAPASTSNSTTSHSSYRARY